MEFSDLTVPAGFTEWYTTQKIFPLNTMTKTFASKLLSQGSIELESIEGCEEFSFWGNLIKSINFSFESAEKPTI